eukprot:scaffold11454_cov99-Isochrysis_galbana.AAC.2
MRIHVIHPLPPHQPQHSNTSPHRLPVCPSLGRARSLFTIAHTPSPRLNTPPLSLPLPPVWEALSPISPMFTIAAAFGNVHGVYKAGNVKLQPELLGNFQKYLAEKLGKPADAKPFFFVFHGGSGSEKKDIEAALANGVVRAALAPDKRNPFPLVQTPKHTRAHSVPKDTRAHLSQPVELPSPPFPHMQPHRPHACSSLPSCCLSPPAAFPVAATAPYPLRCPLHCPHSRHPTPTQHRCCRPRLLPSGSYPTRYRPSCRQPACAAGQDERGHRHPVGLLEGHPRLLQVQRGQASGPDGQQQGPRRAQQVLLRPAQVAARGRGVDGRARQGGLRRPQERQLGIHALGGSRRVPGHLSTASGDPRNLAIQRSVEGVRDAPTTCSGDKTVLAAERGGNAPRLGGKSACRAGVRL